MASSAMNASAPSTFHPPAADQVRRHLEEHPPRGPSRIQAWLPLVALGLLLGVLVSGSSALVAVAPWVLLAGLFIAMAMRGRWLRQIERRSAQAQELAMLRHYPQALRLAWRIIPRTQTQPHLHARATAVLAHCLDRVNASDAAIAAYDALIDRLPPDHPGALQLRAHRSIAQFQADRLLDGDDSLRKLRPLMEACRHAPTRAAFRMAELIQRVRTNHALDAMEFEQSLVHDLRPLGVEAAYGHALMALAHHQLAQRTQPPKTDDFETMDHETLTLVWWQRATLLLPVQALALRFAELQPLADKFAPASVVNSTDQAGNSEGDPS